ncbi:MAG: 4'-phosphopantetheinyl transferase superfamily protein [Candidatus Rickettsiella isopodorum]
MDSILWERPPVRLSISRSELHVWRVNLDNINYQLKHLISLLSPEEIKRSKRFIFDRDRHRYQITHSMKRLILAKYLDRNPQCLRFEFGSHGKPALDNLRNPLKVQFNISHSRDLILIAITVEDLIGIDIEYFDKNRSIEDLGEIIFSPTEKRYFAALSSQEEKKEAFFRCWTRKEAYLKAKGIGLTQDLTSISVDLNKAVSSHDWLKISTLSQSEIIPWKLFPLDIDNYYIANAVATFFQKNLVYYNSNELGSA